MESSTREGYRYYITSAGRIWCVGDEEKLEGEAQTRRELLGNDFSSAEEAALAKAKQEARVRTEKYAQKTLRFDENNNPVIELRFILPSNDRNPLINDIRLLVDDELSAGRTA